MATNMFRSLFVCLCIFANFYFSSATCNLPPQFWCENAEIARKCSVYEQCKKQAWRVDEEAAPVNFALYYESLCPDCKDYITTMVFPSFQKIGSIMNLTLVPYGNAQEKQVGHNWVFECQHGENECLGNIIETCAIALVRKIEVYFPFINCMEGSKLSPMSAAKQCAQQFPVPLDSILNCSRSTVGNNLEHQMALQTDALQPPHEYVPWVTLNGVHTDAIQKAAEADLVKLICDTYQGTKPAACNEKQLRHRKF